MIIINIMTKDIVYTEDDFKNYNETDKINIQEYVSQLSDKEKQVYNIAKDHLGSSFNIIKSNGYCKWCSNK